MPKKAVLGVAPKKVRATAKPSAKLVAKPSKTRAAAAPKTEIVVPAPTVTKKKKSGHKPFKKSQPVSKPAISVSAPAKRKAKVQVPWLLMLTLSSLLLFLSLIMAAVKIANIEDEREMFRREALSMERHIAPATATPFSVPVIKEAKSLDVKVVSPALNLTITGSTPMAAQGQLVTKQWNLRKESLLKDGVQYINLGVANSWTKVPPLKRNDLYVSLNDSLESKLSLQSTAARVTLDCRRNNLSDVELSSSWLELNGFWGSSASSSSISLEAEDGRVRLSLPVSTGVKLITRKALNQEPSENKELSLDTPEFVLASTSTPGVYVSKNYDKAERFLEINSAIDSGSLDISWYVDKQMPVSKMMERVRGNNQKDAE